MKLKILERVSLSFLMLYLLDFEVCSGAEFYLRNIYNTNLALSILMCAQGWCINGRGHVMHSPSARALRNRDRYCTIRVHHVKTRSAR